MNGDTFALTKTELDWLNAWLELWGAWVHSGRLEKRQGSIIATYMATVEPCKYPQRPMCSDEDGLLISKVVDSVLFTDKRAFGILLSYYAQGSSRYAIAIYYQKTAIPRKITTRGQNKIKPPSLSTCRREVDEKLDAALWLIYPQLVIAMNERKLGQKIKKVA